jgi:hypothetical protein
MMLTQCDKGASGGIIPMLAKKDQLKRKIQLQKPHLPYTRKFTHYTHLLHIFN